eukprot:m.93109 g.93109  ORF g.93109 m.93109 type:complete len:89 (-) comp12381_c0_seq1:411-677(-)
MFAFFQDAASHLTSACQFEIDIAKETSLKDELSKWTEHMSELKKVVTVERLVEDEFFKRSPPTMVVKQWMQRFTVEKCVFLLYCGLLC